MLLNVDEIRQAFIGHGYDNVAVLSLERYSMPQQLQVIKCTRILVGVQGAGLTWALFLPTAATVIEITFLNWHARFQPRINYYRPDIRTFTPYCDVDTPESAYVSFARQFFGYSGNMTDVIRQRVVGYSTNANRRESFPFALPVTIWKQSGCRCDVHIFIRLLRTMKSTFWQVNLELPLP